jgi:hypothetical protein
MSIETKIPMSKEESLIDRDSDVFDTEIIVSHISVSRANFSNNVGKYIPFLEVVQATIVPYTIKLAFPFLEFMDWCTEKYSREENIVINKLGFEVLCRVESLSIRRSLIISESLSVVSEPFEEKNIIMAYKEFPTEFKDLFVQTIVEPEHISEILSLPMSVNMMVIEVQWVCSILSHILGLDNEKYVV